MNAESSELEQSQNDWKHKGEGRWRDKETKRRKHRKAAEMAMTLQGKMQTTTGNGEQKLAFTLKSIMANGFLNLHICIQIVIFLEQEIDQVKICKRIFRFIFYL